MKIAILGAGHGGVAAATHVALEGHQVFQAPKFAESSEPRISPMQSM